MGIECRKCGKPQFSYHSEGDRTLCLACNNDARVKAIIKTGRRAQLVTVLGFTLLAILVLGGYWLDYQIKKAAIRDAMIEAAQQLTPPAPLRGGN